MRAPSGRWWACAAIFLALAPPASGAPSMEEQQKVRVQREALESRAGKARNAASENPRAAADAISVLFEETVAFVEAIPAGTSDAMGLQGGFQILVDAANFARFSQRDAKLANERFRRVEALLVKRPMGSPILNLHADIADGLQFSANDRSGAVRHLEIVLAAMKAETNDANARTAELFFYWVSPELEFLRTGQRARGPVPAEFRQVSGMIFSISLMGSRIAALDPIVRRAAPVFSIPGPRQGVLDVGARAEVAALLKSLPPSRALLREALLFLTVLPDEAAVREFLGRNDPSGSVSAYVLSSLAQVNFERDCKFGQPPGFAVFFLDLCNGTRASNPAYLYARKYVAAEGIVQIPDRVPDARLATPDSTWKSFVKALRDGDRVDALRHITLSSRDQYRRIFTDLDDAALREWVAALREMKVTTRYGNHQSGYVNRLSRGGELKSGSITFLLENGEWQIESL